MGVEGKEYKSLYLSTSTIGLLNKLTLTEKIKNSKHSHDDTVKNALLLLAGKRGIEP